MDYIERGGDSDVELLAVCHFRSGCAYQLCHTPHHYIQLGLRRYELIIPSTYVDLISNSFKQGL